MKQCSLGFLTYFFKVRKKYNERRKRNTCSSSDVWFGTTSEWTERRQQVRKSMSIISYDKSIFLNKIRSPSYFRNTQKTFLSFNLCITCKKLFCHIIVPRVVITLVRGTNSKRGGGGGVLEITIKIRENDRINNRKFSNLSGLVGKNRAPPDTPVNIEVAIPSLFNSNLRYIFHK